MRRALTIIATLVVFSTLAHGDPHILASGALITHSMSYGRYPPQCYTYYQYNPISSCNEQNATMSWGRHAWFVIAAFDEEKQWCGVEFGFNDFNPEPFDFWGADPCFPVGGLEIPSANWPGPLQGTAFVTTGTPWTGNFVPVYCFYGYAYDYYGSTILQLTPNPASGFGGFANCTTPPELYEAALGGMGVNCPGVEVCWGWQEFVCCVGTECVLVHGQEECTALGGIFHAEWDSCGPPNPCDVTPAIRSSWGRVKALYR